MFLVAFVLFTYLPLNVTSLLRNLFSVLFLVIVILIKGLCVMMRMLTNFVFLAMYFFKKINISFYPVLILYLHLFWFLLLMMCPVLLLILSQVLCISDVAHCLFLPLNRHLILSYQRPAGLLGFPGPQIGMVFLLLFKLLLILLLCLSLILKLLLKSVGRQAMQDKNFRLFRTIILGTSSLVLLELSLLGANGPTLSSYGLMVLSIDIKLVWWHSGIGMSMGLIMRKHSLPWPK